MRGHIRQRTPGSWELRYGLPRGPDGKRRTATLTFRGSKKEAAAKLRELMGAVDKGLHVDKRKLNVEDHVRARIDHWRSMGRIGGRCAEHYYTLLVLIRPELGSIEIQQLTTMDVERWHAKMRQRGLAARTMRAAHALLARALSEALRHNLVVRNVAREQGPPTVEPSPAVTAVPNAEQIKTFLERLADDPWRVPVIVALYCGLRRGEQLALRWNRVDLDGAKMQIVEALDETKATGITVKTPKTKAGRRTISLPTIVCETLREHRKAQLERCLLLGLGKPADDAPVFPNENGGMLSPHAFTQRWRRKAKALGMPDLNWHNLRHAHASMLISAGVPPTTVAARLGHANPMVTLTVYAHLFDRDDAAAAAAIDKALG
jgi:integrase